MFPIIRRRRTGSKVKSVEDVPIDCVCRMPELPNSNAPLVKGGVYHSDTCVKVQPKYLATSTLWHCAKCS